MATNPKTVSLKILKYVGITIAVLIAFVLVIPLVFSGKIKEEIKKTANKKLNAELNYTDARVSFFTHFPSLTVTLENLSLNGSAPFEKEQFISAKEVAFGINVGSLVFGKSIKIDEIYLSKTLINVKVNKKGEANYNVYIAEKETAKKDDSQTAIKLNKIEIDDSQIVYDDRSTNMHVDVFGFNYLGNGDLDKEIFDLHSKTKIGKLNFIYQGEPYMMDKKLDGNLITRINTHSLSLVFEENDLQINKLMVDLKGKFDILKDGYKMDFTLKSVDSNLGDIFTAFPPKYVGWYKNTQLKGKTDLLLTLKGDYIVSKNLAPDANLDIKIKGGFINYKKSAFPVSNLNVDLSSKLPSLNPEMLVLDIKDMSLNVNKDYLKGKLYAKGFTTPEIDADLKAAIDLDKITQALGVEDLVLKGILKGEIKAKGKYDKKNRLFPVTNATIDLKNGYVKTKYYPNPITDINVTSKISNQKATFNDLQVTLTPAQFTFEGKPVFVTANLSNFDDLMYDIKAKGMLDVSKIYKVFSQKGLGLDGTIKADLALKGKQSDAEKGHYSKLQNSGTLELRNIQVASQYLPKPFVINQGIFKFKQDKMHFNNFLASYGQSDFNMNGYLQNVFNYLSSKNGVLKGVFTLKSKYINADEFMSTPAATPATANKQTTASNPDSGKQETGVIMVPPNLDVQFKANVQKVDFNGLALNNAQGSLQMKNGKLNMKNTGFNLIGCNVVMNANYQGITPQKAQFDYSIKASDFDIKRAYKEIQLFRAMASAAEKAEGIISLDYSLKGKLDSKMTPVYPSLAGGGVVSVKDVKVNGMKLFNAVSKTTNTDGVKNPEIAKVDIKSSIKNNLIKVERFKFKCAGFRPRIEGTTSLDGKFNIKMRLGLPPLGIIGIPLTITGNKDNPKVRIGQNSEDLEETKDTVQ